MVPRTTPAILPLFQRLFKDDDDDVDDCGDDEEEEVAPAPSPDVDFRLAALVECFVLVPEGPPNADVVIWSVMKYFVLLPVAVMVVVIPFGSSIPMIPV